MSEWDRLPGSWVPQFWVCVLFYTDTEDISPQLCLRPGRKSALGCLGLEEKSNSPTIQVFGSSTGQLCSRVNLSWPPLTSAPFPASVGMAACSASKTCHAGPVKPASLYPGLFLIPQHVPQSFYKWTVSWSPCCSKTKASCELLLALQFRGNTYETSDRLLWPRRSIGPSSPPLQKSSKMPWLLPRTGEEN